MGRNRGKGQATLAAGPPKGQAEQYAGPAYQQPGPLGPPYPLHSPARNARAHRARPRAKLSQASTSWRIGAPRDYYRAPRGLGAGHELGRRVTRPARVRGHQDTHGHTYNHLGDVVLSQEQENDCG